MLNKEALLLGLGEEEETDVFLSYVSGRIKELNDTEGVITSIGSMAFRGRTRLQRMTLPACTSVGDWGIQECSALTTVDLPVCTKLGMAAFSGCSSLAHISLPACTYIDDAAFLGCASLTTVYLPVCTVLFSDRVFKDCSSLQIIHFALENKAKIEALSGYSSKWGATNATILFDITTVK